MMLPISLTEAQVNRINARYKILTFTHLQKCGRNRIQQVLCHDLQMGVFYSKTFCPHCGMNMIIIARKTK